MQSINLSILILTHNRPELFQRAIASVLDNLPDFPIEILVNNDSRDISEVYSMSTDITYFYEQSQVLSNLYSLLYNNARGEFIYFLEDDDYLLPGFFDNIDLTYDVNFFEYMSYPLIRILGVAQAYRLIAKSRKINHKDNLKMFIKEFDDEEFQLGQILFRKSKLPLLPSGNNIYNDYKMLCMLANANCSFKYVHAPLWVQTTDGNDNISFPCLNIDDRFKS